MADAREAAAWHRAALVAAAISGKSPLAFVPERYLPPPAPPAPPPTEEENRRGWALLMRGMEQQMGGPPVC